MLYKIINDEIVPWDYQPIDGIQYSKEIVNWPEQDLKDIGLYKAEPADPYGDDKILVSSELVFTDGVLKWVNTLEDKEIIYPVLSARQLRLGLIDLGITLSSIDTTIDSIEDSSERERAKVEWQYSSQFERNHHLIDMIGNLLGMTTEEIDEAWIQSAQI